MENAYLHSLESIKMRMLMQGKATSLHMVDINKSLDEELQRHWLQVAIIHEKSASPTTYSV